MKIKENKSIFIEYFGDNPKIRVLDFLLENHFFDYPLTEIARESNVSYNSLKVFFDDWVKKGIIIKTRKIRKSDYFKLNMESQFVKNLLKLYWSVIKEYTLSMDNEELNSTIIKINSVKKKAVI